MDDKKLLQQLAGTDYRVRVLYNKLITELAKVGKSIDDIPADKLFSFDDYPVAAKRVAELLRQYTKAIQTTLVEQIQTAFNLAFSLQSAMLGDKSILGKEAITSLRNTAAASFLESRLKPQEGLSLSQRIWNYTQQAKSEFEAGMSQIVEDGLLKGISAEELGRKLREMLIHPDNVYRRYHLKKQMAGGDKKDVIEWRKKVVDEEGNVRYVKTDLENVGRGVYRSSRQNVLRLAATEINFAYRHADYVRWQNEPFVIGIRIELSNNHTCNGKPFYDMCDELIGDYPKTFKFSGWHPRCRCTSYAITISDEEMRQIQGLSEDEYRNYKSPNLITEMPKNFKEYCEKNAQKIIDADKRGTLPYWARDNRNKIEVLTKRESRIDTNGFTGKIYNLSKQDIKTIIKGIKDIQSKTHIFVDDNIKIEVKPLETGVLMEWNNGTLGISTKEYFRDGFYFCPAKDFVSAYSSITKSGKLTFPQEYSLECLYHESIHSRAVNSYYIKSKSSALAISEICTQLYAREKYIDILKPYYDNAVKPNDLVRLLGIGYREGCNKIRYLFQNANGEILIKELLPIALEEVNGVDIIVQKMYNKKFSEQQIIRTIMCLK